MFFYKCSFLIFTKQGSGDPTVFFTFYLFLILSSKTYCPVLNMKKKQQISPLPTSFFVGYLKNTVYARPKFER